MDNEMKYYTPDISEFYVGFEYEYKNHDGTTKDLSVLDWKKATVNSINDLAYIERGLNTVGNTRVKYLDQEDIESLGWKPSSDSGPFWQIYTLNQFHLSISSAVNTGVIIDNGLSYDENVTYFSGQIKNKSELQRIMRMIGIQ